MEPVSKIASDFLYALSNIIGHNALLITGAVAVVLSLVVVGVVVVCKKWYTLDYLFIVWIQLCNSFLIAFTKYFFSFHIVYVIFNTEAGTKLDVIIRYLYVCIFTKK